MELYNYKVRVINVVDGDTIDVEIQLGFHLTSTQRLRLLRINTAELRANNEAERLLAQKAKQFVVDEILGKEVFIHTEKDDAFGRYLAEVYVFNSSFIYNLNDYMLSTGLANPYKKR
jgi:micrococcal nuclease